MPTLKRNRPQDWPLVYFFHIPKTGGTSLGSWMRRIYPQGTVIPVALMKDLIFFPPEKIRSFRCYAGHFGNALDSVITQPLRTITILRDPVELSLSHLKHICRQPDESMEPYKKVERLDFLKQIKKYKGDPAACLQIPECRNFLRNHQARFLTSQFQLSRHLGGPVEEWEKHLWETYDQPASEDTLTGLAQAKLDSITGVGIHEKFEDSANLLMYKAGLPAPLSWPHKNASPERENDRRKSHSASSSIRPEVLQDLQSLLQCDYAVYRHACKRFETDWTATAGFPEKLVRWKKIPLTAKELRIKRISYWKKIWKRLIPALK